MLRETVNMLELWKNVSINHFGVVTIRHGLA